MSRKQPKEDCFVVVVTDIQHSVSVYFFAFLAEAEEFGERLGQHCNYFIAEAQADVQTKTSN